MTEKPIQKMVALKPVGSIAHRGVTYLPGPDGKFAVDPDHVDDLRAHGLWPEAEGEAQAATEAAARDIAGLEQRKAALQAQLRQQQLAEEVAALEAQLGGAEVEGGAAATKSKKGGAA